MKMTPRTLDAVQRAARELVQGTAKSAVSHIEDLWKDRALEGYAAEPEADEDGVVPANVDQDVKDRLRGTMEDVIMAVSDALFEIDPDGNNDQKLNQLEQAMLAELPAVADVAADSFKDGVAYNRDPYGYFGTSRSEF